MLSPASRLLAKTEGTLVGISSAGVHGNLMSVSNGRYSANFVVCAGHECKREDPHEGSVAVVVLAGLRFSGPEGIAGRNSCVKNFTVGGVVTVLKPVVESDKHVLRDYLAIVGFEAVQGGKNHGCVIRPCSFRLAVRPISNHICAEKRSALLEFEGNAERVSDCKS